MAEHVKTVVRALELLSAAGEVGGSHKPSRDEAIEDCAAWVVAQAESEIVGLASSERLDAESAVLVLCRIKDMEDEAVSELKLAKRGMGCEQLEREKWLPQRVAELESVLDAVTTAKDR